MVGLGLTTKLPLLFQSQFFDNSASNSTSLAILLNATVIESTVNVLPTASAPPLSMDHMYGVGAAIASTFFAASVYIVVRKAKSAHHSVIMFNFGYVLF